MKFLFGTKILTPGNSSYKLDNLEFYKTLSRSMLLAKVTSKYDLDAFYMFK